MDEARRFEDLDRAVEEKLQREEARRCLDWGFRPTTEQLADLNELRAYYGLPAIQEVTKASEWFRACFEIDERAGG